MTSTVLRAVTLCFLCLLMTLAAHAAPKNTGAEGEGAPEGQSGLEGEGAVGGEEGEGGGGADVIFVRQRTFDTGGMFDGLSWETALTEVQEGIDAAVALGRSEVWVARGLYSEIRPNGGRLQLAPGIALYGGFAGDETQRGQRDVEANVTILDGSEANGGEPALRTVVGADGAHLDGFTIRGGVSAGAGLLVQGVTMSAAHCTIRGNDSGTIAGAILLVGGASLELRDSVLRENTAAINGGAVSLSTSSLMAFNTLFYRNTSGGEGGAIFAGEQSEVYLEGCRLTENVADDEGGAVYVSELSMLTAHDTWFGRNRVNILGGALRLLDNSVTLITNSIFSFNYSDTHGGAVSNNDASPTFIHCTFANNSARARGAVLYNQIASQPRLLNCIVADNPGEVIGNLDTSSPDVDYSIITGIVTPGDDNLTADPDFVDSANANYGLKVGSPAIDTGTSASDVTEDIFGTPRGLDGDGLGAGLVGDGSDYDMGPFEALEQINMIDGTIVDPREAPVVAHSSDVDGNNRVDLSELLRVIQFYNAGGYVCDAGTEDGYAPLGAAGEGEGEGGNQSCEPHSTDYDPADFAITLSELLRNIQLFNARAYADCGELGEDGFCALN